MKEVQLEVNVPKKINKTLKHWLVKAGIVLQYEEFDQAHHRFNYWNPLAWVLLIVYAVVITLVDLAMALPSGLVFIYSTMDDSLRNRTQKPLK